VRVLIVDGSPEVRVRLASRLREVGLDVVREVADGGSALELVGQLEVEAIVVDPQLPDRSGPELVRELRARAPGALLVVLSNDPQPGYRRHYQALGADHFLDKSIELDLLVATLCAAADPSRRK
jgi:DNA-binding NarL/FixJ family response regulator